MAEDALSEVGRASASPRTDGNGSRPVAMFPDPGPQQQRPPAARVKRTHGIEIPTAILRQLVLKHIAKSPEELIDLMNRADVHFLDAADKEVPIDSVAVGWEE